MEKPTDAGVNGDDAPTMGASNQAPPLRRPTTWKAPLMLPAIQSDTPDVDTWIPTPEEWRAYVAEGLAHLGLTYDELAQQARDRNFQSTEALNFWVIIGA